MLWERRRLDINSRHIVLKKYWKTHPLFKLCKSRLHYDGLAFHLTPSHADVPCSCIVTHWLRFFVLVRGEMFVSFAICDCLITTTRSIHLYSTDSITKEPLEQPTANNHFVAKAGYTSSAPAQFARQEVLIVLQTIPWLVFRGYGLRTCCIDDNTAAPTMRAIHH